MGPYHWKTMQNSVKTGSMPNQTLANVSKKFNSAPKNTQQLVSSKRFSSFITPI
jgi:hypothetical protein